MTNVLCFFRIHDPLWTFVGESWNYHVYIKTCNRCGVQLPETPRVLPGRMK